jgi:WD40 repeat protein
MTSEELEKAIVKPAEQVKLSVEPELVVQMIADVQKSPGSLPLLQYALTELWKRRQVERLFLNTYVSMGRIEKILANRADKVYQALSDEQKPVAERIFVELTQLGEGTEDTRRQVRQKDLVTAPQAETLINSVIQRLADEKLLITSELKEKNADSVAVVDIAHEALIRYWPRLTEWVKNLRTKLSKKRTIEKAAKEWFDKNRSRDYLLQGSRLNEAKELRRLNNEKIALSILAQEFIQRSNQWRMIKRSVFTFIISLVLGGFLYTFHKQQVTEMFAKASDINALNESSSRLFKEGKKLEALSLVIEATEKFQTLTASDDALRFKTIGTLQEAIYNTYEVNQLQNNTLINKISFHPISGQMMAYGDSEGIIWLRQRDGQLIKKLQEENNHTDVMTVAFSPDGNKLASGHKNGQVILWNLTDYRPYLSWQAHDDQVSDIRFNPKEEQIIATASYDKQAKLWKLSPATSNTPPEELEPPMQFKDWVNSIDFSPDGSQLAIGSENGKVELWDVKNKKLRQSSEFSSGIKKVIFDSNGRLFFTDNKEVKALDTGESIIPSQHTKSITDIHFSSDDQLLITASSDKTIKIWYSDDDNNFKFLENLTEHEDEIRSISMSPDNQTLLSTAGNINKSVIKVWNIATFRNKMKQRKQFPIVLSISFSTDQQNYAIAIPNNVYICLVGQKTECKSLKGTKSPQVIDFSSANQQLAVGNADGEIQLWNINNDFPEGWPQSYHNALISSLSFSHDGNMLASGSHDNTVRLLDIKNHEVIKQPLIHERPIESIAFSFDDQLLASTEDNGVVTIWKVNSFQKLNQTELDNSPTISTLSFSHDNKWLAFASEGGAIGLWKFDNNTKENNPRYFSKELGDRIKSIVLSSNDKTLVSSSGDKIELWDIKAGILLKSLISPSQVQQLRFGTDDKMLFIGGKKEIVSWLFDLKELLKQGCNHLQAYLKTHKKKICFFKN